MAKRCGKAHGHPMIARIVGNIHVGTPPDEAVAIVRGKLVKGAWEALSPADRRAFECEVKRVHAENLKVYRDVMTGRFG